MNKILISSTDVNINKYKSLVNTNLEVNLKNNTSCTYVSTYLQIICTNGFQSKTNNNIFAKCIYKHTSRWSIVTILQNMNIYLEVSETQISISNLYLQNTILLFIYYIICYHKVSFENIKFVLCLFVFISAKSIFIKSAQFYKIQIFEVFVQFCWINTNTIVNKCVKV